MKRILIATGIFPPDIGGPATYGANIVDALTMRGFKVSVAVLSRISRKIPKGLRHFLFFLKLLFLARKSNLIFSLNAVSAGFPALLVAKIYRKRFMVRVAGDYAWEIAYGKNKTALLIDDFQKINKKGFLHKTQFLVCRKADGVIVPSEYLKNIVKGWGVKEEKIKVIYNGIDFRSANISKEEARNKIGIHGNIIISVGRLVPWKGFRMLIKIMPRILEIDQFARLVIIGDGPEKKNLETMIKNLGLEKKVFMVGKKSQEDLALYFAASNIFVLNSGYEGFSHQLLEAMEVGVPVVASGITGNKEIVRQGENGFLVKYNDEFNLIEAIKTLHQNSEIREEFIKEGKNTVQNFSIEKMINKTIKLLESNG